MKPKILILILLILVMMISGKTSTGVAYTELDGGPANISGRGEVPLTVGPILDDFDNAQSLNKWNCSTGTFSSSTAVPPPANARCTASFGADISGTGSKYSLKLDYNVTATDSYAGYFSQMGGGNLTSPTAYTAISFYVKGSAGGEFFKIQLKNTSTTSYTFVDGSDTYYYNRNEAAVYITDYLDGGVISTDWKKVTIPLHNFANLDGFNSMKEFVIVFENSQSTTNGSATSGTVYIDNIAFETTPISAVRVDHFGDKLGVCALGGGMGTGVGGGASATLNKYSFSNTTNEYDPAGYPNGLKLEYNVNTGYAYTFLIFGGANNAKTTVTPIKDKSGWIALPHNFSAYTKLTFRIRAKSEAENPKIIKIELLSGGGTSVVLINQISSTVWQGYALPLSGFVDPAHLSVHNLDETSIKQLTFVFEDWRIPPEGGSKAGVVFIDSIQFE